MTIEQKMRDEYRLGFKKVYSEGYVEVVNEAIATLKGILDPAIIAEKYKVPLKKILGIWEQE